MAYCINHGHDKDDNTGYHCWECDQEELILLRKEVRELNKERDQLRKSLLERMKK